MVHPMGYPHWGAISPSLGVRKSPLHPLQNLILKGGGGSALEVVKPGFFFFVFAFFGFARPVGFWFLQTPSYDLIIFQFFFHSSLCSFCGMRSKIFFANFRFRGFWFFWFSLRRKIARRSLCFAHCWRASFSFFVACDPRFF